MDQARVGEVGWNVAVFAQSRSNLRGGWYKLKGNVKDAALDIFEYDFGSARKSAQKIAAFGNHRLACCQGSF